MNKKVLVMIVTFTLLLGAFFGLRGVAWDGSPFLHTLMETVASVLAFVIGTIALIRYYAQKEKRFLFIGAGFFGTALLDTYHTIATSEWFLAIWPPESPENTTWSWHASRIFLSLLMFLSWRQLDSNAQRINIKVNSKPLNEKYLFISVCILSLTFLLFFAFAPLPLAHYPQLLFGRPQEFVAAIFFLLAFVGYARKNNLIKDPFDFWLACSLLIGFLTQALFMSSSFRLNDGMYNVAHVLKIIGYVSVLIGLFANLHQLLKSVTFSSNQLSLSNQELQSAIAQKESRESQLKHATGALEEKVRERTTELENSRLAAFNMMEDANEAKKAAEEAKEKLDEQANKLARSNKELEQFAYVASHDLQEPLRTVGSFVQLLAQRYQGKLDQQAEEFIQFAVEGVSRMRQLINDLLVFSRVETKGGEFAPTDCELVLGEVLSNLKASIDTSNAAITKDQLPMLMADKVQLSQVFQNLIGNAIKFRGEMPPRIHIGAKKQDRDWLFSVKDNGIGFDPEFSEKVFIIFQRLHNRNEYPGTGIGLSLCKKIVERHGGKIWVDSAPSRGSTFNFTIPDNMGEHNEYSSYEQTNRNTVG